MAETRHSRKATFLLRLWVEDDQEPADKWRGRIEHVQSGEGTYFRDWEQALRFINEVWEPPEISPPSTSGIR